MTSDRVVPISVPRRPRTRPGVGPGAAAALLVLVAVGPFVANSNAQAASRAALTAAIAEHGTVDISGYPIFVDHAIHDGRLRSDKAPGQPVLAVPGYALWRAAGGNGYADSGTERNLTLWWLTLWSSVVPAAALVVAMRRHIVRAIPEAAATAVSLGWFAGSLLLGFTTQTYGHLAAAFVGYAGYLFVREDRSTTAAAGAGLLAGIAVAIEYPSAIVAGVVMVVVARRGWRSSLTFIASASVPLVALGIYHWRAFGAPWHLPYSYFAPELASFGAPEGGFSVFRPDEMVSTLVGAHGIVPVVPLVAVALGGAIALARARPSGDPVRQDAIVGIAVTAAFIVLAGLWSGSAASEVPGPRYIIPALGFLAVPCAEALRRWPRLTVGAMIIGALTMTLAVLTPHLVTVDVLPLSEYVHNIAVGDFTPTVWTIAFGVPAGIGVHAVSVALVVAIAIRFGARASNLTPRWRATPSVCPSDARPGS